MNKEQIIISALVSWESRPYFYASPFDRSGEFEKDFTFDKSELENMDRLQVSQRLLEIIEEEKIFDNGESYSVEILNKDIHKSIEDGRKIKRNL